MESARMLEEVRMILIGGRWAGKSFSGNTILRKNRFECGRTRTVQAEVRHEEVEGRKLIVVDAPGWSSSLSISEIPEGDKQNFKLNASKCPPGPHVFLLVIPIDCAFTVDQRRVVEEHMKLLGERVWRYTMVLFTSGDVLGQNTIEQHIESEGDGLKWLIDRCGYRYHVLSNKEKKNSSQVAQLLDKIEEMVWGNNGAYFELDEQMVSIIKIKQQQVAERAEERRKRAETLLPEGVKILPKLRVVLLGSRSVGKTSVRNVILGIKETNDGTRTAHSEARRGFVGTSEITIVDTPSWWKGFPVSDTPETIKEEVILSMFLCRPRPHVFLLVIDADASFNGRHLQAATTHMELLGEGVWQHTMLVFTRGDWLGSKTIEQYIEGEGEAMKTLVELCGNRYHVMDNKNPDGGTQVTRLLEKITGIVAENGREHFAPDEKRFHAIEEKRRRADEGARLRRSQFKAQRESLRDAKNELQELRILMLGQKTSGKTAAGNNLLRKDMFASRESKHVQVEEAEVAGRHITVIDTPGWQEKSSRCTEQRDNEIVQGALVNPLGVHAVLLVVPLDLTFTEPQQVALEEHMNLFGAGIWKHTMVLFTYGDYLADKFVEEHIEGEHRAVRWLVDKCSNRYHVMNNLKKTDVSQVTELFEKIEEVVAANNGQLYCPDAREMQLRMEEKFKKRRLQQVVKQRVEEEFRRRELELMLGFKETLLQLQDDARKSVTSTKPKTTIGDMPRIKVKGIGQKKKDGEQKEEKMDAKIGQKIEQLDKEILESTRHLQNSKDFIVPDLTGDTPIESDRSSRNDDIIRWLSTLGNNSSTLNYSQTSGYRSVLPHNELDTGDDSEWNVEQEI
ncbi:uncharacterized protein V6R79_006041 [Siganus canaliculatus]